MVQPMSWQPDPEAVSGVLPARIAGGPFTSETVPTDDQVEDVIDQVCQDVIGEVGPFDPARVVNPSAPPSDQVSLGDLARRAATLGAASQIEDSLFPEQQTSFVGVDSTASSHLFARYRRALERLAEQVRRLDGRPEEWSGSLPTPLAGRR